MTISVEIEWMNENGKSEKRKLAIGDTAQKRCGVSFNPANDSSVDVMKVLCAAAMESVIFEMGKANRSPDQMRCFNTALTHIEAGQMFAVKGLFQ